MILMLGQRWLTCSVDILPRRCGLGKGFVGPFGENCLTFGARATATPACSIWKTPPVADRPNWTLTRLIGEIKAREGVTISRSRLSKVLRKKSSAGAGRGTP